MDAFEMTMDSESVDLQDSDIEAFNPNFIMDLRHPSLTGLVPPDASWNGEGNILTVKKRKSDDLDPINIQSDLIPSNSKQGLTSVVPHKNTKKKGLSIAAHDSDSNNEDFDMDAEEIHLKNSSDSESYSETELDKARKTEFFAVDSGNETLASSFQDMHLSRPILKALDGMSFYTPTPIQATAIPAALLGKDVVGNAVTGSGKTAAFIIPVLERLLYREKGKKTSVIRCVILVPTRELAVQCVEVGKKLAMYTDIRFTLIVGGLSLKSQEAELRSQPDIVVATPGRLIDHLRNTPTFALDALDILILDEADRMLSDGFAEELKEIITSCPLSRQTMLFSATMTDSVDKLIKMSLNKPVRLFVDPKRTVAQDLTQDFVRIKASRDDDRMPSLIHLCENVFTTRVIIFVRSKRLAHQLTIIFGILGMNCNELHGDMSQEQRFQSLQHFREKSADFLIATDLAARGLDISDVDTVINYDMPNDLSQYLHRIGRTARAGRKGRSVTLIGEADRRMLKSVLKHCSGYHRIYNRTVTSDEVARYAEKLKNIKDEVSNILKREKEEKAIRQAEMEIKKGQNGIEHHEEIFSRPARTWFKDKRRRATEDIEQSRRSSSSLLNPRTETVADKPRRDEFTGLTRKAKRRKVAPKQDADENSGTRAAVRMAKKRARPVKLRKTRNG